MEDQENSQIDFLYYWQVLVRRRWIVVASTILAMATTAVVVFSSRPIYEAQALILIEKEGQNTITQDGVKVDSWADDYYQTQYQILKSRSLSEKVLDNLDLRGQPEFAGHDPVESFRSRIDIRPVLRTRLVHVAFQSYDRDLAARAANAIAQKYVTTNLESKLFLSKEVLKALQGSGSSTSIESLPAVVNSPLVQELKIQLAKLQGQYAELSRRYQPQYPRMIQLDAQIRETKGQISQEVQHIAESIKIQLSGQFQENNIRIVDLALPPENPIKPQKRRALIIAFLLGLSGGFVLGLFIDRFDLTVRTQDDVERLAKIPFLGALTKLTVAESDSREVFGKIWDDSRSHAAEAFRNLRTAITFRLSSIKGSTNILVTSSAQGEGKSLICANVARAFAQAGERVLLIDGDLRRPSVHKIFSLPNEKGLSDFLLSGDEPSSYLVDSGIANLKVIPCGPVPGNPSELLTDRRLKVLFGWANAEFDRVIVDSAPIFPVTDALLWAKQVHGVVFVILSGQIRAALVQRALQKLKESFTNVIGGVLNQSIWEHVGYYYYYNYYLDESAKAGKRQRSPSERETAGV